VGGKGLAAQHQEVADQPRDDRNDGGGLEGVLHEVIVKHRPDVLLGDRARGIVSSASGLK
jgi:hypothetical protein